jgi:hypothetical protein
MWRFWTEGKEIYATVRHFGPIMKFSIHHSGQIHMRQTGAAPVVMAPAVPAEGGPWMNALELRFLTSEDTIPPPEEKKLRGNERAFGLGVPAGHFLYLNLLFVRGQRAPVAPLPPGNQVLWTTTLSTREPVALIGRLMPQTDEDRERLRYLRHELNPHANFEKPVTEPPYIEIRDAHWGPGGNIVFIVPMGHEGYRGPAVPPSP